MASSFDIKSEFSQLIDRIRHLEKKKKVGISVLLFTIIAMTLALTFFLNQKTYTVLFSGMDATETGEVLTILKDMGVDAKTRGEDTILVSGDNADDVRLELAAQGYPASGMNYDIYSLASGLGTTDAEKKVYYKYQTQANLRATLLQMDKVENATVLVDLGEDSDFVLSNNNKPATASIMLTLKDGTTLDSSEVRAIQELVATSISGLDTANIHIVDSQMNLYSPDDEEELQGADSRLALKKSVQDELQKQIVNLLSPVFGEDNVLAQVSVTLDFDTQQSESVEYSAPAGKTEGIVSSLQELVEAITNDENGAVAGIDANGNASQYLEKLENDDNAVYYNISREVNYEINKTTTQIQKAQGQIAGISVAVVLNSSNTGEYADEVKGLVATAIGANMDSITVERLPFQESEPSGNEDQQAMAYEQILTDSLQSTQMQRLVVIIAAASIIFIFLLAIIRILRPQKVKKETNVNLVDMTIDNDTSLGGAVKATDGEQSNGQEIAIQDQNENLAVLEDYIEKNPESVANLLRNWLNEE